MLVFTVFLGLSVLTQGLPQPRLTDGGSHLSPRVAGGSATTIQKFPYMVSVREDLQGGYDVHVGGGSIISNLWVLTSRQHVLGTVPEMYVVRVGSADIDKGQKHTLAQIVHYNKQFRDDAHDVQQLDICLLKVAKAFTFSNAVKAVKLEAAGTTWGAGTAVTVAGWGPTLPEGVSVEVLREVTVDVVANSECTSSYKNLFDQHSMICVSHKNLRKGACVNDEGAPLVHNDVQIGLASFTSACFNGTSNAGPAIYTSVAYFRSWIKTETGV